MSVVAGVDGTRAAFEAARQAALMTAVGGRLVLVAALDAHTAAFNRGAAGTVSDGVEGHGPPVSEQAGVRPHDQAERALREVRSQLPPSMDVRLRVVGGRPWDVLRAEAAREGADLVVVGSHGGTRLAGVALGSTAAQMLHHAACSVMVARQPFDPGRFPASMVVGLDDSAHARAALEVVRDWHRTARRGATVRCLAAKGSGLEADALARLAEPFPSEVSDERAVDALLREAAFVDLVVVGARGLTGLRALGSVSERVAHGAPCSVLIVADRGG